MTAAALPGYLDRLRQRSLAVGGIGLAAALAGFAVSPPAFFRSWLVAFLFWVGVAIGCQSILMIQHLTGGLWGLTIRRILEAGSRTLFFAALFFVPLALGLRHVFVWADPAALQGDPHLKEAVERKALYLNPGFFLGRALFYFVVWGVLAYLLSKWSAEQDRGWTRKAARRLRGLSGGGLVLMGLTITFSSVDWGMSLDPRWFSTIYGVLFMVGQALSALCFAIVVLARLGTQEPLSRAVAPQVLHDLGKLLFAFVMLWAYVNLSQFIIVWSGNLPEEVPFYLRRMQGGWGALGLLLIAAHFLLPFLLLLSRDVKRNASLLATIAAGVFAMRMLDLLWLVGPELRQHGALALLDLAALLGVGGLWLAAFASQLASRPLLPVGDPELEEALGGGLR
jgi:hypothetical protein